MTTTDNMGGLNAAWYVHAADVQQLPAQKDGVLLGAVVLAPGKRWLPLPFGVTRAGYKITQERTAHGSPYTIEVQGASPRPDAAKEQLMQALAGKKLLLLVRTNNADARLLGTPDEPVRIIADTGAGPAPGDESLVAWTATGRQVSFPAYYTAMLPDFLLDYVPVSLQASFWHPAGNMGLRITDSYGKCLLQRADGALQEVATTQALQIYAQNGERVTLYVHASATHITELQNVGGVLDLSGLTSLRQVSEKTAGGGNTFRLGCGPWVNSQNLLLQIPDTYAGDYAAQLRLLSELYQATATGIPGRVLNIGNVIVPDDDSVTMQAVAGLKAAGWQIMTDVLATLVQLDAPDNSQTVIFSGAGAQLYRKVDGAMVLQDMAATHQLAIGPNRFYCTSQAGVSVSLACTSGDLPAGNYLLRNNVTVDMATPAWYAPIGQVNAAIAAWLSVLQLPVTGSRLRSVAHQLTDPAQVANAQGLVAKGVKVDVLYVEQIIS